MSDRAVRLTAVAVAAATAVLLAATFALQLGTRSAGAEANFDPVTVGLFAALLGFAALITTRRHEPIGWVFLAAALVYAIDLVINQYADYTMLAQDDQLWPGIWAGWLSDLAWFPANSILMASLFLLFPDGRLPGSRWAFVAGVALAMCAVELVAGAFHPGSLSQPLDACDNPAAVEGADWISWLMIGAFVVTLARWGAAIASLVARYRRSDPVRRAQIRWFTLAAALVPAALVLVGVTGPFGYPIMIGAMLAVPVSVGWLMRDVAGQSSALAVTLLTLAVAAAFQPLRIRIQRAVNHRFSRRAYDAGRTLAAFSGRLRNQLDLEALTGEMVEVVHETLRPARVMLWLRPIGGES